MNQKEHTPDIVAIEGLRFYARHGVYAEEREAPHPFIVDIEADVDTRAAAASDELGATISYADLAADARAVIEGEPVALLETLAQSIAERVIARDALGVTVTVHKPEAPVGEEFSDAYVRIYRANPLAITPAQPVRAVIALGGNIGNTEQIFADALEDIKQRCGTIVAISPYLRTTAVLAEGGAPQADYTNGVLLLDTPLSALDLLAQLQAIEAEHGRERTERWGPRTLDLDVIDYAGMEANHVHLIVPHPRAARRLFVLEPWAMIEPEGRLLGQRVSDIAAALRREEN